MNTNVTFLTSGSTEKPETKDEPSSEASDSSSDLLKDEPELAETDSQAVEAIQALISPTTSNDEVLEPADEDEPVDVAKVDDAAKPDVPDDGKDGESDDDGTVTIKELADHLGTSAEKVYRDLRIPMGTKGESLTIAELKDSYQAKTDARAEISAQELLLQQRESASFAQQQELATIMGEISPYLTPETVQLIETKHRANEARERQSLMEKAPELTDPAKFDGFRDNLVDMMGEFGFEPHEVVVVDHRMLLVAREMLRLRNSQKRWAEAVEDGKLKAHKTVAKASGGKGKADGLKRKLAEAAASPNTKDKVAAVSALIGE